MKLIRLKSYKSYMNDGKSSVTIKQARKKPKGKR